MNSKRAVPFALALMVFSLSAVAFSQQATTRPAAGASNAATDAERAKIWNSPTMLRARAWVQDYCSHSAKITPDEAKEYMAELERLSPKQMKLWLLKFDHEQEMMEQQQAAFDAARKAAVSGAMAVNQATQQAYSNINRDETEAAEGEEQSLAVQRQNEANAAQQQAADRDQAADDANMAPLGNYGYGMYPGYGLYGGPGMGNVHYHIHVNQ